MGAGDILAYISAALLLVPALYVALLAYLASRGRVCRLFEKRKCILTAVIPVYREPLENVVRTIESVRSWAHEIIVVWDGGIGEREKELVTSIGGGKLKLIVRSGRKGKASALNEALRHARGDYIVVVDAGDTVEGDVEGFCSCCSVVAAWEGRRVERSIVDAVSAALNYARTVVYHGRCSIGLPVFFLGTGSSVARNTALSIGGWREEAILEDVEFGFRLVDLGGCSPCYTESIRVRVEVPPSYTALRIQQMRWMRGVGQIIARRWWRTLDQLIYILQYPMQAMWHPLLLAALALGVTPTTSITVFLVFVAAMALNSYLYLKTGERDIIRRLRLGGAAAAIGLLLTPSLVIAFIEGLAGLRGWGPPTPRTSRGFSLKPLIIEVAYAVVSTIIGFKAAVPACLIAFTYPIALLYLLLRFPGEVA